MNVWFDISNSPHINMFYDLIKDLENEGHEITITSRPLANTVELLNQRGLKHTVIGEHYGKNFYKKLFGYPIRVMQLRKFLRKHKPDLSVSQSSFHAPVVARLLSIPSIYTNDNEHALGNMPAFISATKVFIPESLSVEKVVKKGASRSKISQYPGVKEGVYLWKVGEKIYESRKPGNDIKIYVRPEPLTAQYYKGGLNFLDDALISLQAKYTVTILPRDKKQLEHYRQERFSSLHVPDKPMKFADIAIDCSLFIGAGGSMTREMAILGIPTISVYQDDLLSVDEFLIDKNLMMYEPNINAEKIEQVITQLRNSHPDTELLDKGKQAYTMFKSEILKFNKK
jgi:uncharacterized protein